MKTIKSICVFCGSSSGSSANYTRQSRLLANKLATHNITLVYGGSNVGLMREIADTMLEAGGTVIGVMPLNLIKREVAHGGLSDFRVVDNMAERKALMNDLSDAFIAMPGGVGTLDELFEMMSWKQLELIDKPVALFNIDGYFDDLMRFLDHSVDQHFVKPEHRQNLICESDPEVLLDKIMHYQAVKVDGGKWIKELKDRTFE